MLLFSLLWKMMKPSAFKLVVKIPSYTPDNCLNEDDISDVKIEAVYRAERMCPGPSSLRDW